MSKRYITISHNLLENMFVLISGKTLFLELLEATKEIVAMALKSCDSKDKELINEFNNIVCEADKVIGELKQIA